jgi:hypothetical protein
VNSAEKNEPVYMFSLKSRSPRYVIVVALSCMNAIAQAQLGGVPEFLEKHFSAEATDAQFGPKLHTQFNYIADSTLFTSNSANMNNDGFENHMAVGIAQSFSDTSAKVSYNSHRFDYTSWDSQTNDVTFDLKYRTLRVQHRLEETAAASTIGLPIDLSAAHLDLSFRKTHRNDTADTIDEYRFVSRFNRLKYSATWTNSAIDTGISFSTEFRPSDCCLMKYTYTAYGNDLRRKFRSEFTTTGFRLAGEFMSEATPGQQSHIASAIGIEKDTKLAELKLRLEHNEFISTPTMVFKLESRLGL